MNAMQLAGNLYEVARKNSLLQTEYRAAGKEAEAMLSEMSEHTFRKCADLIRTHLCAPNQPYDATLNMLAALEEIEGMHIGDCPAAFAHLSDDEWARRCHGHLRSVARAAIARAKRLPNV